MTSGSFLHHAGKIRPKQIITAYRLGSNIKNYCKKIQKKISLGSLSKCASNSSNCVTEQYTTSRLTVMTSNMLMINLNEKTRSYSNLVYTYSFTIPVLSKN